MPRHARTRLVALTLTLLFAACSSGPRQLHYGQEECAHCRMVISDERYAAQLVTAQGASRVFDDIACLAAFLRAANAPAGDVRGAWLADFDVPGAWIAADDAWLLRSEALHTPMGGGQSAHASESAARALQEEVGGTVVRWAVVLDESALAGHDHAHD